MMTVSNAGFRQRVATVQGGEPAGEPISADIGTCLVARNLGDMRAFINLADFVRGLLPTCGPSMFRGWAYLMTLDLVAASGQRPLLSGFYRMLTVIMRLTSNSGSLQPTGQHSCANCARA
jgi:DNA-dependent protein kinase catalytic subunit